MPLEIRGHGQLLALYSGKDKKLMAFAKLKSKLNGNLNIILRNIVMLISIVTMIVLFSSSYSSKVDESTFNCTKTTVDSLKTVFSNEEIRNEYRDKELDDLNTKIDTLSENMTRLLIHFKINEN